MTNRRPLVIQDGLVSELFPGDQAIAGYSPTEVVAGSGLGGGGSVSSDPTLYVQLPPNPSGLIISSSGVGTDGVALTKSNTAAASGYASVIYAETVLTSGNAALFTATSALASGNAALTLVPSLGVAEGTQALLPAGTTIASGQPVGFDDAGKVQAIRRDTVVNNSPMIFGPRVTYEAALTVYPVTAVNTNVESSEFLHIYADGANSYYPTAVLGNIVGSSGVYGTPVVVRSNNGGTSNVPGVTYCPDYQRYVVMYNWYDGASTYYLSSRTVATSGTQLFLGTEANLGATAANLYYYNSVTYDRDIKKPVYVYGNAASSFYVNARTGTITGNTITLGAALQSISTTNIAPSLTYTKDNKTVAAYQNASSYGECQVIVASGTVVTYGVPTVFRSASTQYSSIAYDSFNDKLVASFNDASLTKGTSVVGSVSGTTTTFSTSFVTFAPSGCSYVSSVYDSAARNVVVSSYDTGHARTTAYVGTVSGDSISFVTPYSLYGSGINYYNYAAYSPGANKCIFTFRDGTLSNYGVSYISSPINDFTYNPTQSGFTNFIGVARSSATSGTSCLVDLTGSIAPDNTNSLVPSTYYYLDPTLSGFTADSAQPTQFRAAVPWAYLGKAVSTSGLYLLKSL